jgi:maltose O-acetyltransferase
MSTFRINQSVMLSEKEKMLCGELYNASDPVLAQERLRARVLLRQFNDSGAEQLVLRKQLLKALIPLLGSGLWIEPPFYCDYGSNIRSGDKVYFNFNCTILDVMQVTIGSQVLIGPAVQIYTALHPMNPVERVSGLEFAKPVTIGSEVWIGGGAIICPGVTIGCRSVIGAGSVVTKNIPDDVFAAGNPCRYIKSL